MLIRSRAYCNGKDLASNPSHCQKINNGQYHALIKYMYDKSAFAFNPILTSTNDNSKERETSFAELANVHPMFAIN